MVFRLAKDQFAYINIFRKAIDAVEEYKKHLWLMVLDRKVERNVKVQALRELHNLSKTYTYPIEEEDIGEFYLRMNLNGIDMH